MDFTDEVPCPVRGKLGVQPRSLEDDDSAHPIGYEALRLSFTSLLLPNPDVFAGCTCHLAMRTLYSGGLCLALHRSCLLNQPNQPDERPHTTGLGYRHARRFTGVIHPFWSNTTDSQCGRYD